MKWTVLSDNRTLNNLLQTEHLHAFSCGQLNLLTKYSKIDANQNERHAKDLPQNVVFDTRQGKDGYRRDNNKSQQYGPESLPGALMLCGLMLNFILRPKHYLHLFCCF